MRFLGRWWGCGIGNVSRADCHVGVWGTAWDAALWDGLISTCQDFRIWDSHQGPKPGKSNRQEAQEVRGVTLLLGSALCCPPAQLARSFLRPVVSKIRHNLAYVRGS